MNRYTGKMVQPTVKRTLSFIIYSDIWPDTSDGLWWEGSYKRGTTVL